MRKNKAAMMTLIVGRLAVLDKVARDLSGGVVLEQTPVRRKGVSQARISGHGRVHRCGSRAAERQVCQGAGKRPEACGARQEQAVRRQRGRVGQRLRGASSYGAV